MMKKIRNVTVGIHVLLACPTHYELIFVYGRLYIFLWMVVWEARFLFVFVCLKYDNNGRNQHL